MWLSLSSVVISFSFGSQSGRLLQLPNLALPIGRNVALPAGSVIQDAIVLLLDRSDFVASLTATDLSLAGVVLLSVRLARTDL